ncbi:type II secretion system minor pseudopilin GspI [Mixta theicola]|nr:type II secretion system minor pseudopilin GspI [Mixta theicola]
MKEKGMTLLEVLVAIFIIAVSASAVVRIGSQQANTLSHLQQKQLGIWLADNKLVALSESRTAVSANWRHEETIMADRQWFVRWRSIDTTDPQINALVVEVRNDKKQNKPLTALQTYVSSNHGER